MALSGRYLYWTRDLGMGLEVASIDDDGPPSQLEPPSDLHVMIAARDDGVAYTLSSRTGPGKVWMRTYGADAVTVADAQPMPGLPVVAGDRIFWVTEVDKTAIFGAMEDEDIYRPRIHWRRVGGGPIATLPSVTGFRDFTVSGDFVFSVGFGGVDLSATPLAGGPSKYVLLAGNMGELLAGPDGTAFVASSDSIPIPEQMKLALEDYIDFGAPRRHIYQVDGAGTTKDLVRTDSDIVLLAWSGRALVWVDKAGDLRRMVPNGDPQVLRHVGKVAALAASEDAIAWADGQRDDVAVIAVLRGPFATP